MVDTNVLDQMVERFTDMLKSERGIDPGRQVNPADAYFSYRLLLGRSPDPASELPGLVACRETYREFLTRLLDSSEYQYSSGIFPANRMLMAEVEGFRFWFNSSDREMGVVMALGQYEPHCVALLKKLLRPGMRCLDIGAQTGFFTCLMAALVGPGGAVHAFEPMPANCRTLERNLQENGFTDRVTVHPLAASNAAGEIEGAMVSNMYVAGEAVGGERVRMRCARVDDLVTERIDLVKIDIEGHEPRAIDGMRALIRRHRPVILTEANEYWLRTCGDTNADEYVGQLAALGYEVFRVKDFPSPAVPGAMNLDVLDSIDLVAFPART